MSVQVLVVHAPGTNRDGDMAEACTLAGGNAEIVTLSNLVQSPKQILDYDFLVIPGGFSYGDDLGAGKAWSSVLRQEFKEELEVFVKSGRPVLGVCNGFQTLLKAGLIPGADEADVVWSKRPPATLTNNESGQFECRWVRLEPDTSSVCVFTKHLNEPIDCPVAHGEGRVALRTPEVLAALETANLIPFRYTDRAGSTDVGYPINPNGSVAGIAALCNPQGNVMGMMPHPENHIYQWQRPSGRAENWCLGLPLFEAAIRYAKTL
jgi:phosphoribosylformylglycinamidine synthase I